MFDATKQHNNKNTRKGLFKNKKPSEQKSKKQVDAPKKELREEKCQQCVHKDSLLKQIDELNQILGETDFQ